MKARTPGKRPAAVAASAALRSGGRTGRPCRGENRVLPVESMEISRRLRFRGCPTWCARLNSGLRATSRLVSKRPVRPLPLIRTVTCHAVRGLGREPPHASLGVLGGVVELASGERASQIRLSIASDRANRSIADLRPERAFPVDVGGQEPRRHRLHGQAVGGWGEAAGSPLELSPADVSDTGRAEVTPASVPQSDRHQLAALDHEGRFVPWSPHARGRALSMKPDWLVLVSRDWACRERRPAGGRENALWLMET